MRAIKSNKATKAVEVLLSVITTLCHLLPTAMVTTHQKWVDDVCQISVGDSKTLCKSLINLLMKLSKQAKVKVVS